MTFTLKPGQRPGSDEKITRQRGRTFAKPPPRNLPPIYVTPHGEQVFDWPEDTAPKKTGKTDKSQYGGGYYRIGRNGAWQVAKQYSTADIKTIQQRVQSLGFTLNQFANRAGLPTSALTYRGPVPLHVERLVEYEELLAALADALDKPQTHGAGSTLRHDVAAVLMMQVRRLP
jgi:hypothetical protein